jgi:hypothetical protein
MKKSYEESQVPSAKEQIEIITKKETLCAQALEKKLLEEEEEENIIKDKGKGKEKEKEKEN